MRNLVRQVGRWWKRAERPSGPDMPFEVPCTCGQRVTGLRRSRHQTVRCDACGAALFVLGRSPLPAAPPRGVTRAGLRGAGRKEFGDGTSTTGREDDSPAMLWRWPLLAAIVTLLVVGGVFAALFVHFGQRGTPTPPLDPKEIAAHVKAGERALAAGKFQLATDELQAAQALLSLHPDALPSAEGRRVNQLERQAELLVDLLSESLGEILQRAAGMQEEEWQAQFARRYRDHAVIFDADVRRQVAGQIHLDYQVRAGAEQARIEIGNLKLLALLPADRPPRLLFGARLATVAREGPGIWMVRFAPESGVLLTDLGAVSASCPPPIDEDLLELLRRQEKWVGNLP
jgi:hypothetical protein